jgi:hypothetical protein
VFEVEEDLVLLAQVVCPVVYRGAVGSRRLHHIYHDSGDINFVSPRERLLLRCFVVCGFTDSSGVLILLLLKEGSDSVLSPELLPRLFRQVIDHFSIESNAGHSVQDDFVRDHVTHT